MLEPTWNPTALPVNRVRAAALPRRRAAARVTELVYAAPYSVVAIWTVVAFAGLLVAAVTGRRELLDWCRSDAPLAGAGTLTALAALVATLLKGATSR